MSASFTLTGFPLTGYTLGGAEGSGGATGLVPNAFPVALAGVPYLLDRSEGRQALRFVSAQRIRQQADQARRPGEQTLNPEGDWRRSFQDWRRGAGQKWADARESLDDRFHTSKGIDVWNEGEIRLLPDTTELHDTSSTNLFMAVAGSEVYICDGVNLRSDSDPFGSPTWGVITSAATQSITGIASAGHHIFIARGTDGIWHTENGDAAEQQWNTGSIDDVWYVKGRVMTVKDAAVYNPTDSWTSTGNSLPTALFTHPNDEWTWVGMAEGLNHIYMGGYAGDHSEIYRTAAEPDGTALDVPVVAGRLPDGEILRSIEAYLADFVLLGTDKGVRVANADANGDLLIGALIETTTPVRAFEGQGQFVWFTWEDYDGTSGGLGRMDLTSFTQRGAPAYASDLMATTSADIQDVVTFDGKRIFSVSGDGFYGEHTDLVASGTLTTGDISYDLTEHKLAKQVEVRSCDSQATAYGGSFTVALSTDSGSTFTTIGSAVSSDTLAAIDADETLSVIHDIRITLTRDGTDATLGPCVTGFALRVHPHSDSVGYIIAQLAISGINGADYGLGEYTMDALTQQTSVETLHQNQNIVTFQSLGTAYSVTVEDYDFDAMSPDQQRNGWHGTMTVRMKRV